MTEEQKRIIKSKIIQLLSNRYYHLGLQYDECDQPAIEDCKKIMEIIEIVEIDCEDN